MVSFMKSLWKKKKENRKKKQKKKVKKKRKEPEKELSLGGELDKSETRKKENKKKESGPITLWTSVDTNIFVCCVIVHRK